MPGIVLKPAEHALVDGTLSQTFRDMLGVDIRLGANEAYSYKFKWQHKPGFVRNISMFVDEFKRARGLTPLRIVVLGMPYSGKTSLAKRLAESYGLPYISLESVFQETVERLEKEINKSKNPQAEEDLDQSLPDALNASEKASALGTKAAPANSATSSTLPQGGEPDKVEIEAQIELLRELGEYLKFAVYNRTPGKTTNIQTAQTQSLLPGAGSQPSSQLSSRVQIMANTGSSQIGLSSLTTPVTNKDLSSSTGTHAAGAMLATVIISENPFPESHVTPFLRSKLRSMKCLNQGYVLDAYPTTVEEATALFSHESGSEELAAASSAGASSTGGEHKSPAAVTLDPASAPTNVLVIKCPENVVKERAMRLSEAEQTILTCEAGINKRLEDYAKRNTDESTVLNYFDEAEIFASCFETTNARGAEAVFDDAVRVLGRPHNYGPPCDVINQMKARKMNEAALLEKNARVEEEIRLNEESERTQKAMLEWNAKLDEVRRQEQIVLEAQSLPLRQYLMKNVMPNLTAGLIELCKVRPEDPIDYLAEYLFRQSSGAASRADIPVALAAPEVATAATSETSQVTLSMKKD